METEGSPYPEFEKELTSLLNKYSMDSKTHIPDFILASHVVSMIAQLPYLMGTRDRWFGFEHHLTRDITNGRIEL